LTIFVGIDWAEEHHDVCVLDGEGAVLASRRIPDGLEGVALLHALLWSCPAFVDTSTLGCR